MNRRIQTFKYILADWLAAITAWSLFYTYRKLVVESNKFGIDVRFHPDKEFFLGITLIPLFWLVLYALTGCYRDVYRRSRLKELGQTLYLSLIGVLVIFFALLLD